MNEIIEFIARHKVVVICRGLYDNELIKAIRALYDGGIRVVEVIFDQVDPDTVEKICGAMRTIKGHFPQMRVGSGTVTCIEHVSVIKRAGGKFCLSPGVDTGVIRTTKEAGLISTPGTMASTRVLQARNAGVDVVKISFAGWLGLSYLKDIKGPINHVKFLAAAGVNEEDFKECLNTGHCAAGISGRFIDRKVIAEGNFKELTRRARMFTNIADAC